jgi:Rne/Rng family ribonuclease
MSKKMLFNMSEPEEIRGTITENGKVIEYDIETRTREKSRNNIYRGYVVQIETSLQAAFVEYGAARHGFLPFGEIHPDFWSQAPEEDKRPRIDQVMRKGQMVVVQVVREEVGNKGAALTTYCTLPGRYLVLMPLSNNSGISRKIETQSERRAIRELMRDLRSPEGFGYIVRTAGLGVTKEEIERDLDILVRLWRNIQKETKRRGPRTGLIFEDGDLIQRMIRDYYESDVDEIFVDEIEACERASTYFSALMPNLPNVVKFYQDPIPLFSRFEIEHQLEQFYQHKITLPSGGSIVIDTTEALVAIDVNSGKTQSENTEDTAYKTNLEAAQEIARQLRLRDLGGLIVIDFIGMRIARNIRGVERVVRQATKSDKARIKIGRISSFFGLLTLSRQRIRDAKSYAHFTACPVCQGVGKLPNTEASAMLVLRHLKALALQGQYGRIVAKLPPQVALYLLNQKRDSLTELEEIHDIEIELLPGEIKPINLKSDFALYPKQQGILPRRQRKPVQIPFESETTSDIPPQDTKMLEDIPIIVQEEPTPSRTIEPTAKAEPNIKRFVQRKLNAARAAPKIAAQNRELDAPIATTIPSLDEWLDVPSATERVQTSTAQITVRDHIDVEPLVSAQKQTSAISEISSVSQKRAKSHLPLLLPQDSHYPLGMPWFFAYLQPKKDALSVSDVLNWLRDTTEVSKISAEETAGESLTQSLQELVQTNPELELEPEPNAEFEAKTEVAICADCAENASKESEKPTSEWDVELELDVHSDIASPNAYSENAADNSSIANPNHILDKDPSIWSPSELSRIREATDADTQRISRLERINREVQETVNLRRQDSNKLAPMPTSESLEPEQTVEVEIEPEVETSKSAKSKKYQRVRAKSHTGNKASAEKSSSQSSSPSAKPNKSSVRIWSEDELQAVRELRSLPLGKAYQQFLQKGFQRGASTFRHKYYSFDP